MKNTLQLEIINIIKKGNEFYSNKDLKQSIKLYDQALSVFEENMSYNSCISAHFQGVIYSLRGLAHLGLKQYEIAQCMLQKSLQINPHDVLTLIRRATLYYQTNRLGQAIEDAQKAYICDPESKTLSQLIKLINNGIEHIDDESEKIRMRENLKGVTYTNVCSSSEELDEEENLNFSNLKNIDKMSQQGSNKFHKRKSSFYNSSETEKSCEKNKSRFAQSEVNDQSDEEYCPISIIQKNKNSKAQQKSRSIVLKIQDESDSYDLRMNSHGFTSIGNIEGKGQRRSSVTFSKNFNNFISTQNKEKLALPAKQNEKRKSCLRNSKLVCNTSQKLPFELKNQNNAQKRSSFLNIKNIDGLPILSPHKNQKSEQAKEPKKAEDIQSDQDNSEEHNIFGEQHQINSLLKCLQNLKDISNKNHSGMSSKKGSILKKNSVIGSEKTTNSALNIQKKKSVCFQDQNTPLNIY